VFDVPSRLEHHLLLINVLLRFETVCLTRVYGAGMIEILEKKKGILVIGGPDF